MSIPEICLRIEGRLVVSCQAEERDAFYGLMDRFARAAVDGGAAGIRANGVAGVRAIRQAVDAPVIGIQKSLHTDGRILITPSFESARALVEAGAQMIALDCTVRGRQSGAFERMRRMKAELCVPVLADIATVEEAVAAARAGADLVLSTMRGYTDDTTHIRDFDPGFIEELVRASPVPVIAEGRVDTPELARQAIRAGAFCVIVGTAITRPHLVTRLFASAVERESVRRATPLWILGVDLGGTNTKSGLVSAASGALLWDATVPTPAAGGRAALLAHLKDVVRDGLNRSLRLGHKPVAVGIATAGWVDPAAGSVVYATENLPGWTGTPIAAELQPVGGLPVFVENDANALAVGERHFGAGKGLSDFVSITIGTGVGGGCYVGGRLN
ncbi:MAG: putative N-acetylmannosamine-6-phosphate 2-epimerase, partial [Bryobacteraceae bacterium]